MWRRAMPSPPLFLNFTTTEHLSATGPSPRVSDETKRARKGEVLAEERLAKKVETTTERASDEEEKRRKRSEHDTLP